MTIMHAIFAGGCFWGIQATFDAVKGVVSTTAGYTGGTLKNPSYEKVCSGSTNHAEAVLINYDDSIITFENLLDIFFSSHDPTQLNRQGMDIGSQYRSAIFTTNSEQEAIAIKKLEN